MDTTHARIQIALRHIDRAAGGSTLQELAEGIQRRQLEAYRVHAEGTSITDYMQPSSIADQIRLMEDLGLVQIDADQTVSLTTSGRRGLESDEAYDRQIRSSVKSLLRREGLPLSTIVERIEHIELPSVPDPDTIYNGLENVDHSISRDSLRTLLFLLACADGIDRVMRVHYRSLQ